MKTLAAYFASFLVVTALLASAACVETGAQESKPDDDGKKTGKSPGPKIPKNNKDGFDTPSAFKVGTDDKVKASIPKNEILKGIRRADPRDAIPPIYEPKFESLTKADEWIRKTDRVLVFEYNKTARAYPIKILNGHEIVNDKIGKYEFAIVY